MASASYHLISVNIHTSKDAAAVDKNGADEKPEKPDNSLCIAIVSLVAAIPALIGS